MSGAWDPGWAVRFGDFDGDRRDDVFLYNESSGLWVEALVDPTGAFTYFRDTWSPGWQVVPTRFTSDVRSGLLLYASSSGVWFRMIPQAPGTFSFTSGSSEAGRSLVAASPRVW